MNYLLDRTKDERCTSVRDYNIRGKDLLRGNFFSHLLCTITLSICPLFFLSNIFFQQFLMLVTRQIDKRGIVCGIGFRAVERSFRVNSCEQLRFCKYLWALLFSRCVVAFFPREGGEEEKKKKKKGREKGGKKKKIHLLKNSYPKWTARLKRCKGRQIDSHPGAKLLPLSRIMRARVFFFF